VEGCEDVVRKTRQKVDDEPSFEIVHADDARLGDDLAGRADERHVEVEEDVDEEDDVDDTVDHEHWHVVHRLALRHATTRYIVGKVHCGENPCVLVGVVGKTHIHTHIHRVLARSNFLLKNCKRKDFLSGATAKAGTVFSVFVFGCGCVEQNLFWRRVLQCGLLIAT